jgi:hypothetical protein
MRYNKIALAVGAASLAACAVPSRAVPVFARKYGFNCSMCHSTFPRLNDFGQRYRDNGYRLMGREEDEKTVLESPTPLALRTNASYNSDQFSDAPGAEDVNQFQLNSLDILSAGLLGRNIGYFVVYPPKIEASRGVVGQPGTLEMANVVFSGIARRPLSVRAGRFETEATPFSPKRHLSFSPYEIYDFSFPGGTPLSDTKTGIEIVGLLPFGARLSAGWVDGSGNSDDAPADFYVRAAQVIGRGEGQTAGHRVGLTGYFGKARQQVSSGPADRESITRLGVDASLNFQQVNLALQYIHGQDDRTLWGTLDDVKYDGGFAEATYTPSTKLAGFARYDWVNTDNLSEDISRWTAGARYYLEDNVALHAEYSHRRQNRIEADNATEDFFTIGIDFAM